MSPQKQRHARAMVEVTRWKHEKTPAAECLRRLNAQASNPQLRDVTPHMVTACRLLEVLDFTRAERSRP